MWYTSSGGMRISFSTHKPCTVHMGVLRTVGFVQAIIALLTRILSSFSLLGFHVRDSQFAYRWCHSPTASVEPRAILGQYHNTVISPSEVAERSKARTLPTQKVAPHLRTSSGEYTATNCPTVISMCGLNVGNASSPLRGF